MFQEKDHNQELENTHKDGVFTSIASETDAIQAAAQNAVFREQVCLFFIFSSFFVCHLFYFS